MEEVVEHERGMVLFGYPFFSDRLLVPGIDPERFVAFVRDETSGEVKEQGALCEHDGHGKLSEGRMQKLMPIFLEDAKDEKAWYVMMDHEHGGVDDQGWSYSWAFRSKRWQGKHGLVRKRTWVRLPREPRNVEDNVIVDAESNQEDRGRQKDIMNEGFENDCSKDGLELIRRLNSCKIDRERFNILEQIFSHVSGEKIRTDIDQETKRAILKTFQFETSRRRFMEKYC